MKHRQYQLRFEVSKFYSVTEDGVNKVINKVIMQHATCRPTHCAAEAKSVGFFLEAQWLQYAGQTSPDHWCIARKHVVSVSTCSQFVSYRSISTICCRKTLTMTYKRTTMRTAICHVANY
jgi:hypothetical protein